MSIKFCPFCGKSWSGTPFCAYCGKNLRTFIETANADSSGTAPPDTVPPTVSPDWGHEIDKQDRLLTEKLLEPFETEDLGNETYAIVGLKLRNALSLEIPDCVVSIGDKAFEGCAAMEITLPESVVRIGRRAFAGCPDLESIKGLGSHVRIIDDEAFADCPNLEITLPEGSRLGKDVIRGSKPDQSDKAEAARKAFEAANDVRDGVLVKYRGNECYVVISDCVTSIGENAFSGCSALENITIPNSVTSIDQNAFSHCSALKNITIPDSVTSIGDHAFLGCSALASITVERGNSIFHSSNNCLIETESKTLILGCKNSVIPTDGSVTSIGHYAFHYCTALENITIPDSVTSIGCSAFSGCTALENITIPDSVTRIYFFAFSCCSALTSITLPGWFRNILSYTGINSSLTRITYT